MNSYALRNGNLTPYSGWSRWQLGRRPSTTAAFFSGQLIGLLACERKVQRNRDSLRQERNDDPGITLDQTNDHGEEGEDDLDDKDEANPTLIRLVLATWSCGPRPTPSLRLAHLSGQVAYLIGTVTTRMKTSCAARIFNPAVEMVRRATSRTVGPLTVVQLIMTVTTAWVTPLVFPQGNLQGPKPSLSIKDHPWERSKGPYPLR